MQWRETEPVVKSASISVAMMRLVLLAVTLALTVRNGRVRASWPSREVLEAHVAGTTEYTFDNHIDHFRFGAHASGASTYKQRYFVNKRFWRADGQGRPGPIFFYAGNESPVELYINNTGLIWENARSFGALVMFAEHRYYGRSQPFGENSIDVDASYLLAEQALADYATLLWTWKRQHGAEDAPVVAFGGSYGGMLAAWLRLKYPHVVAGAVAASAPLGAFFGAELHFQPPLFWKAVTYDASEAAGAAAGCVDRVRSGFAAVLALGDSAAGRSRLSAAFQLCKPLQSAADAVALAYWLQGAFDAYAMGNYPFPTSYMGGTDAHPLPAWPMRAACSRVMASDAPGRALEAADLLAALRAAVSMLYNATQDQSCFSLQTQGPAAGNVGPWDWQWCTEMLPQELPYFPSNGVDDMFWDQGSFSWTGLREHCRKAWAVSPQEHHTVVQFGGLDVEAGSNIVFSNGEYDPWRVWGVLESASDSIVALDIRYAAHHLDLMFSHPDDPPSVRTARQREMQEVAKWIGAYRQRRAGRSSFVAV